ncbi:sigma-54 dependent transcriptional regulator [bacterium]|nr:sigma-54 dependent transcriptional regulator [bacterium]
MKPLLLIVDDDSEVRKALARTMKRAGYGVIEAADSGEALELLAERPVELLLTDLRLPTLDGIELVRRARERDPLLAVIVLTGYGSVESAVEAMRAGAHDYLTKPVNPEELLIQTTRALETRRLRRDVDELRARLNEQDEKVVSVSPAMRRIMETVEQLASTSVTVLIGGPSGVGKEVIADIIQRRGDRRDKPFVKLHCAALAEGLLESELFGHEKGAFTGAIRQHRGAFERADGGTLFLDEIGEIPLATQVKLLRVLQDQRFERVGGEKTIQADVRLIAATNKDLAKAVEVGEFRDDLYYRLKVVRLMVPPLAERPEDMVPLIARFVEESARRHKRPVSGVEREALDQLLRYSWPGNVRELKNTIEGMVALARGKELTIADLPPELRESDNAIGSAGEIRVPVGWKMEQIEREVIRKTLQKLNGNRTKTADLLGIGLRTLHRKIKEFELN